MSKKVLVTGASRGIGFAIAKEFAARGYTVFATYRNTTDTLSQLPVTPIFCDVSDAESVRAL